MTKYTLESNHMCYAPGIIRWAISKADYPRDRNKMIWLIQRHWKIPKEAASALVSGAVGYRVKDGQVTFLYPDDTKRSH